MDRKKEALHSANEASHRLTREAIETALFYLMKKHRFEEITVTDIIRRSGVSRTAFYKNYRSKEDIINSLLSQLIRDSMEVMHYTGSIHDKAQFICRVLQENRENFRLLLDSGLEKQLLENANNLTVSDTMTYNQKIYMILWNGAIFNLFCQMIRNDDLGSPEDLLSFVDYVSAIVPLPDHIV